MRSGNFAARAVRIRCFRPSFSWSRKAHNCSGRSRNILPLACYPTLAIIKAHLGGSGGLPQQMSLPIAPELNEPATFVFQEKRVNGTKEISQFNRRACRQEDAQHTGVVETEVHT